MLDKAQSSTHPRSSAVKNYQISPSHSLALANNSSKLSIGQKRTFPSSEPVIKNLLSGLKQTLIPVPKVEQNL